MIVPTAVDKGVGPHLATAIKDETIRLPTTVFDKNRYQDQIRYGDSENHSPDEAILKVVVITSSNILKCLNQHKNWHGYHFLGGDFKYRCFENSQQRGGALLKGCNYDPKF